MTRPFQAGCGDSDKALVRKARAPIVTSLRASNGLRTAEDSSILTTSPISMRPPTSTPTLSPNLRKRERPATR
jgi:hypothetical protein